MAGDHGRVRETRAGLEAAATKGPVMAMLSELMTKMVVQGRVLGEVQASVAGLHVKVDWSTCQGRQVREGVQKI